MQIDFISNVFIATKVFDGKQVVSQLHLTDFKILDCQLHNTIAYQQIDPKTS